MTRRVLIVGGTAEPLKALQSSLLNEPYELVHEPDPKLAEAQVANLGVAVVVAFEDLGEDTGAGFLSRMRQQHPQAMRILIANKGERVQLLGAINEAEVFRIVTVPVQAQTLAKVLRGAFRVLRVAEAQETIWAAAKLQQDALEKLLGPQDEIDEDEQEQVLGLARLAGSPSAGAVEDAAIGELSDELAQRLSLREREIVEALGSGHRVKDIARELVISTHTVRNHLKAIYRKLNVRSQFELISMMVKSGKET